MPHQLCVAYTRVALVPSEAVPGKMGRPRQHGSLEAFGGPQRHAIAHLKAGKMVIPNMSYVMLAKSVLFKKIQYLYNIRNYFFWPDLRRLPSQQKPNIWYVLLASMLESNPVVRNIREIHLRLHKLRCIPILTLHFQHGSHSPPPAASLQPGPARPALHCGVANLASRD